MTRTASTAPPASCAAPVWFDDHWRLVVLDQQGNLFMLCPRDHHDLVCFYVRPAGFSELRGSCVPLGADLLPPPPAEQRDADVAAVVRSLLGSYGGQDSADH